jgi:hypothetical protein
LRFSRSLDADKQPNYREGSVLAFIKRNFGHRSHGDVPSAAADRALPFLLNWLHDESALGVIAGSHRAVVDATTSPPDRLSTAWLEMRDRSRLPTLRKVERVLEPMRRT